MESQQKAAERLSAMTKFLASLPAYQVTCRGSYDVLQDSGQKLEFLEERELALQRPDRLRVRHRSSDGDVDLLVFDGKHITLFNDRANVYAQAPQPGSLDDAIVYFVRDLKMRLPLARLFTNRSSSELARRLQSVVHIERTRLLPVPTDHIAGRVGNVDVQLWIAEGDRPLPMRVVLTYVDEPGQPQYRADFQNWKTEMSGGPDTFRFSPPAGARRIVFASQLPPTRTSNAQRGDTEAQP
ncbi:MAG TPA: DUF2092 domain-containing protein [Steroidobacteraceae bacterium]|nr:DUF2092 domain-containing protein [Steroidobacteraceae bacterium]